jgi:predicted ferric reductase
MTTRESPRGSLATDPKAMRCVGSRDRRNANIIVAVLIAIGVLTALWPVAVWATAPGPAEATPLIAHLCGMLAGYGVLVMVVLMSRWPLLERRVGSDRLTRWHSSGGRIVLLLVLGHAAAAVQAWAQSRHEGIAAAILHIAGLPWMICATIATVMLTAVAVISVGMARNRIRFERWHSIHLLVYIAIALSFLHQLGGPDLAGHTGLQIAWSLLYTHTFALVLRYRVIRPLQIIGRHRLRVQAVVPETRDTVSIIISGHRLHELGAQSGQFFRWRFLTPDTWSTAHPFSLSAAPRDDLLRITIKAVGDGSRLLQSIDVGTWVIAEGPYGAMTPALRTRRNVLLIAGGVGITPMRALFESTPTRAGEDLLLLYRARSVDQLVFRSELEAIADARGARIVYLLGPSRDQLSSPSLLAAVPDLTDRDVYLCGPPAMANATRQSLKEAGLPVRQLHEERFG